MKKWLLPLALLLSLPAQAADVLHLYNWNDYIAPETIERFERECGCKVNQSYFSDAEEMLAKLAAGAKGYDVMVPSTEILGALIKQGALMPLDKNQLPNIVNMDLAYMNIPEDPGNRYTVPYAIGTTLIGYNEQKLKELGITADSWALIFEPEILAKIKGKVTVLDSPRELIGAALIYLGYSVNTTDREQWKQAAALIARAKPYWAAFNASSYIKELATGSIWVAHGYSMDLYQARVDAEQAGRDFSIGFVLPKEGANIGMDHMAISAHAPRPDLAHKFINFMMDGRNASELTNMIGNGNPNRAARPYIRPELLEIEALFPSPELQKRLQVLEEFPTAKDRRDFNKLWTELKLR